MSRFLLTRAIRLLTVFVSIPLTLSPSVSDSISTTPPNAQCNVDPGRFLNSFGNHPVQGVVVGFLDPDAATRLLQTTQAKTHMTINPDYVSNPRALVHVDGSPEKSRVVALVDKGLTVRIGDHVEFVGGHADAMPCHYIPNLIGRILSES